MRMRAGWMLGITVVAGAMSVGGASRVQAQATGVDSTPYVRAREMVANGETEAGRHLVDSLLKAAQPGSPEYAEGLYWRAAIAASGRDAERDYRQIVVDYPTSPRVAPALLRMGQLEAARGDREASMQHFQRLVIEHPESPLRAEASYWVANSYLGKNDLQHGCTANADALEHVSAGDVELKNRIDYQQLRCRNVRLAGAPAAAAPAPAPAITAPPKPVAKTIGKPAKKAAPVTKESTSVAREVPIERPAASAESTTTVRDTAVAAVEAPVAEKPVAEKPAAAESSTVLPSVTKATKTTKTTAKSATKTATRVATKTATKTATKAGTKATTRAEVAEAPAASSESTSTSNERGYAVQVAAYKSRVQADSLAAKLRARGWASHVDGDGAPYRVRIGHYARRADAVSELRRLKAKKIDGFVTEP